MAVRVCVRACVRELGWGRAEEKESGGKRERDGGMGSSFAQRRASISSSMSNHKNDDEGEGEGDAGRRKEVVDVVVLLLLRCCPLCEHTHTHTLIELVGGTTTSRAIRGNAA